jgi:phenylacetate-coenzyme A ligase PaaK-like adenylate-forming protein
MKKSSKVNISDFLQDHPEFVFDLEEYILAVKHKNYLSHSITSFLHSMKSGDTPWPYLTYIVKEINNNACYWVPFYREYKNISEIQELPYLKKTHLRTAPEDFLAANLRPAQIWKKSTTGSSGPSIPIFYSAEFYFDVFFLSVRKAAARAEIKDLETYPVFCVAISDNQANQDFIFPDPLEEMGVYIQIVVNHGQKETYDRLLDLLYELQPACISTKPSILEKLSTLKLRPGTRPPAFLISSGACLEKKMGQQLKERFHTQAVVDVYGLTEFGLVASQCSYGELHINTSALYAEIIDEEGCPLPYGEQGEIVLSSLNNLAMPLLRYCTGDLGALEIEKCGCGSTNPRLVQLSGRKISCFKLKSGEVFSPTHFNDFLYRFPVFKEFQISQLGLEEFEVLLEFGEEVEETDKVLCEIQSYFTSSIPGSPNVKLTSTNFLEDSKFERYRTCF